LFSGDACEVEALGCIQKMTTTKVQVLNKLMYKLTESQVFSYNTQPAKFMKKLACKCGEAAKKAGYQIFALSQNGSKYRVRESSFS